MNIFPFRTVEPFGYSNTANEGIIEFSDKSGAISKSRRKQGDEEKNPIKITPNPELFVTQTQFAGCDING